MELDLFLIGRQQHNPTGSRQTMRSDQSECVIFVDTSVSEIFCFRRWKVFFLGILSCLKVFGMPCLTFGGVIVEGNYIIHVSEKLKEDRYAY